MHGDAPVARRGAGPAVVRFANLDLIVMSAKTLRQTEQVLAARYGVDGPPKLLDADDLESDDLADVEHWVRVYTELAEFTRDLLDSAPTPEASAGAGRMPDQPPGPLGALRLQAEVQQLHLAFWLERLNRLRTESGPDPQRPG